MDTRGIYRKGRGFFVDAQVQGHKVRRGGFKSRAQAAEWIALLRTEPEELEAYLASRIKHRQRTPITVASFTVAGIMDKYMKARGDQVATADRYRQCQAHVQRLLGPELAEEVRQRHVDKYEATRRDEDASNKTIKLELTFLRTCLRYAWLNDALPSPPRFVLRIKCSPRKRVASPKEAGQLLSLADLPLRRAIDFAWSTGMRAGGIREARWAWVNATNRTVTIPAAYAKNGEEHTAPIPPLLWELLQEEPRHEEFLFCHWRRGRTGKGKLEAVPWTKSTLGKAFARLRDKAGITDLRFHDFRRSLASLGQERGHSPAAVRAVGGWLDPNVMQRHYSHASDEAKRRVAEDMESLLVGVQWESDGPEGPAIAGQNSGGAGNRTRVRKC